ncbi:MAG: LCP family protein [Sulfobacillus sp.]
MPTRREKRPRTKRLRWAIWTMGIVVIIVGVGYGLKSYYSNLANVFPTNALNSQTVAFNFQHRITILLMGSSLETSASNKIQKSRHVRDRSDTLILVSINPQTRRVGVISIPRDTRVDVPHIGMTKIAESTFFGGAKETVQVVENTFHVPIDYYAYISMFQFAKVINDMGGLTVNVPQNEVYQPSGGKLGINLHKGLQHLSGWQVLQYARFRNTAEGDIGRIQQQQQILKDIAKQMLQPKYIPKIPQLANDLLGALSSTNLNTNQLVALALFARHVSLSTVRFGTIPGSSATYVDPYLKVPLSYWIYDPHLSNILIQDVLLSEPLTMTQKNSLKIEINSGTTSLSPAQTLAKQLTAQGYHVTAVGWANRHNHRRSVLVNSTGDKWLGQRLSHLLGPTVNQFAPYHTTPWDIKITLGSDYTNK